VDRHLRTAIARDASGRSTARVTYWTGIWEPHREGISKEVAVLRDTLAPGSPIVSFTPQPSTVLVRERVVRLNFRRWKGLRLAAVAIERFGALTHIFGGIGTVAHFLHLLGRRPILFTVVIGGAPLPEHAYARVARFVVESDGLAKSLRDAGIGPERIEVLYPPVDLEWFAFHPPPAGRFQLLFASTPAEPSEIDARGIGLLIELARRRPEIDVVLMWRRWGRIADALRDIRDRRPPANLKIIEGDVDDMPTVYRQAHATVCAFQAGYGKSAPNSILEGLACGRPALVTDTCGIADLIGRARAGEVAERTVEGLCLALDALLRDYGGAGRRARRLAETELDERRVVERYRVLYAELRSAARRVPA
jgi:glycosyltransferase involved in cell wall biosynthesis